MGVIAGVFNLERAVDWLGRVLGSGAVIAYHGVTEQPFFPALHVTAAALAEQLDFLGAEYDVIPLEEFVARRRDGRSLNRCASITFDDGYAGVLDFALPLLEQRHLPATVFVVPEYTQAEQTYWWDRLEWIRVAADPETRARIFMAVTGLQSPTNEQSYRAVAVAGGGRIDTDAEGILADAERLVGSPPVRPLSESELRQLGRSDLIDFGCHSMSHRTLPALTVEEQRREIRESHAWIAGRLPRARWFVAYPFGLYNRETMRAARDAGMLAGFTMQGHAVPPRFSLLACPRVGLTSPRSTRGLRLRLSRLAIPVVVWRNRGCPRVPKRTV